LPISGVNQFVSDEPTSITLYTTAKEHPDTTTSDKKGILMLRIPYVNPTLTLSMLMARETSRSESHPLICGHLFPVPTRYTQHALPMCQSSGVNEKKPPPAG
jgi:hypothetical protein